MSTHVNISALLGRLGLQAINQGAWSGTQGWSTSREGTLINVRNPSSGSLIAQVRPASAEDYETVMSSAVAAADAWRRVPAPKRGEAICSSRTRIQFMLPRIVLISPL